VDHWTGLASVKAATWKVTTGCSEFESSNHLFFSMLCCPRLVGCLSLVSFASRALRLFISGIIQFFVMNYIHDHSVYTTLFLVCCELSKNTGSMEIIQVFL
jgi:hypothetical protein